MPISKDKLINITDQLFEYCRSNNWAGYDPYDALNSELFKKLLFLDSWLPRLALTQLLKRSPINFRPLLMIPKTQNLKALALFLMAFLKLDKAGMLEDKNLIPSMAQTIIDLRSGSPLATGKRELETVNRYYCWGYSFPWQGRSVLAPRGEPNIVCTVFVANALLDLYESENWQQETADYKSITRTRLLSCAISAADYLLNELFWSQNDAAGFSYPIPTIQTKVHNANFLGAALFCRINKHTCDNKYLEPALKAARYSARMQQPDGAWNYGEHETQHWIDNFHTGYNLGALRTITTCLNTDEFMPNIQKGFEFYRNHFFREDAAPKYFYNKVYPIDIHSVAQSIITLLEFKDRDPGNVNLAFRVFEWAIKNMWDDRGYFYYQITTYYKNRIPYMRWTQAWMLLALSMLLEATDN